MENNKIVVITPHPDDETLGCGGYLLNNSTKNDIYWLIITNISESKGFKSEVVAKRQHEITQVASAYGFRDVFKLDYPTANLDQIPQKELISSIASVFAKIKPSVVFLPNKNDVHTDHRLSFEAGYACTKNFRFPFVRKIFVYETLSETEFASSDTVLFNPNTFMDISNNMEEKIRIFKLYESEIMDDPLPRSLSAIYAHAQYRGSRIGVKYAEAYKMLLNII